jgi:hypothetical protein
MMKRLLFSFSTVAVGVAFAVSSYHLTLFDQSSLAGKSLKAGDYKLELNGNSVALKQGKATAEAPARIETAGKKFSSTMVRYNDQREIQEICIGGTNKKVVIGGASASGTAEKQSIR